MPGAFWAVMAGARLGHKRCILFRERRGGEFQKDVVLYPFAQMANGQQDSLRLAAARIALLPASGKGLFLLSNLKFGQQKSMAQADFVFGECFDRCGRKLGQAKARSNIPGALAAFGRDEFDGILRLLKAQERGEALRLVKRMHVLTLEVFDKLRLQYLSVGHLADAYRHGLFLSHRRATIPAFSENDLKTALRAGANQQRLQYAVFTDAGGEFLHRIFVECLAWVSGGYNQPIERQVAVLRLSLHLNHSSHGNLLFRLNLA